MAIKNNKVIIFDLDDTLYNEIDFLKSAYRVIALKISNALLLDDIKVFNQMLAFYNKGVNAFEYIIKQYDVPFGVKELLDVYRNHKPKIELSRDTYNLLNQLKSMNVKLGLLTDGRSTQQRNKIEALGLDAWFSEIIISEEFGSEKPHADNYKYFEKAFGKGQYHYIGDNIKKDFITPNMLNWVTICLLDNGLNIHDQNMTLVEDNYKATLTVSKLLEIIDVVG